MKILVVFTYNYSLRTWKESGTLNKELKNYKLLTDKGIEFVFLTFDDPLQDEIKIVDDNIQIISVFEKLTKSKFTLINYLKSFLIPFYFKNEFSNIDLIKQNQLNGSWISIILKFLLKKPLITRTGYDMYEFSIKENKTTFVKALYKYLTLFTLKFSNLYTVSSVCDFNFLKNNFNFQYDKVGIRPNWVEKIEYYDFEKRLENKIICIGRLVEQKNYEFIISEFQNTEYEIDLIGEGSLQKELEKLAINLNTKVNFLGNLDNDEIMNLLPNYRYYLSASKFEGNPKSTLEAMSAGCIVFASDIKNHKEIIMNEQNGFIFSLERNSFFSFFISKIERGDLKEISISAKNSVYKNNSIEKLTNLEYEDYLSLTV